LFFTGEEEEEEVDVADVADVADVDDDGVNANVRTDVLLLPLEATPGDVELDVEVDVVAYEVDALLAAKTNVR